MGNWRLAESLKKLRDQINAAYPNRDRASDGSIGDASHKAKGKSDHNPNGAGVVCAIDIDEDLSPNNTVAGIVASIQASRDPRVKYIIYEGRITVKGDITKWKAYSGPNPHKHHAHISVVSDAKLYDSRKDWSIGGITSATTDTAVTTLPPPQPLISSVRDLKLGDKGDDVKALQRKLGVTADGIFGLKTKKAVINIQVKNNLRADGIVGKKTRAAIGV